MKKVRMGSVVQTDDGAFWYACGDWRLKGILNAYPCMLAYVPQEELSVAIRKKVKLLVSGGRKYGKAFGHFGVPIERYREELLRARENIIHPVFLGRAVFFKNSHIVQVRDPVGFLKTFMSEMKSSRSIFQSLADILHVPLRSMGISGSNLVIGIPVWRHENDIIVYGRKRSQRAFLEIQRHRDDRVFSRRALAPFHTQFRYRGKWFDPLFGESMRERPFIDECTFHVVRKIGKRTYTIIEDHDGIFFPAVYRLDNGKRLISFRLSHRGLFAKGQHVTFSTLSVVRIRYPSAREETAYAVLHDEWATPQ